MSLPQNPRRARDARRAAAFEAATRWELESPTVDADQPHWMRRRLQRTLRRQQYAIVAELDAYREPGTGMPYRGQDWARYRDSRGRLGVDRWIADCLRVRRASRRAPPHTPWGTLLRDWTPERRCAHAFAVDAQGQTVHHDDPSAVRWCLGGWLAHRCQKPSANLPHRRAVDTWADRTNDREARRLLDEIWALVPERTRAVVERIQRERLPKAADRKRLDQHPLGYWWFLSPYLAARWLQITPGAEDAPSTVRTP